MKSFAQIQTCECYFEYSYSETYSFQVLCCGFQSN